MLRSSTNAKNESGSGPRRLPAYHGPVAGPLILVVLGVVAGWVAAGPAGAAGGLMLAAIITGMVAVGAAVWVRRIGSFIDVEDARAVAPCPPGFGRLCRGVYRRTLDREFNA